ncbi:hypothetical protein AB0K47_01265 [Streptomyces tirandamycinicus]|uniref:hypothetical protein n=1 Tax=Streptomyces TaxID=1883 RepID=UPI00157FBC27|nr:hypothetical protein [Streptomyces spongiicola]
MYDHTADPTCLLSQAADDVRSFNHVSRATAPGWDYPSHAYDALGALSRLTGMLPQALEQIVRPVTHTHGNGRVLIDGGGDADVAVEYLRAALSKAVHAAAQLSEAVQRMHSETSPMGLDTRGLPAFEDNDQNDEEPAACARCRKPFDHADLRHDGAGQYASTPWCRRCIDHCHDGSTEHVCVICDPARYGGTR